ncbi:MAG: hypothetical protein KBT27_13400 [Prevotellaceae bacterium]|nr:hypothetical protein [Candidatus Faecinaster equi]
MKLKELPEYCANHHCLNCKYNLVCYQYFKKHSPSSFLDFIRDADNEIKEDVKK